MAGLRLTEKGKDWLAWLVVILFFVGVVVAGLYGNTRF